LERVFDPRLRYRPVAVGIPPEGSILSCSPEAREEGIRPGMGILKAKRLCPKLTILRPDPHKVERALNRLYLTAQGYTPVWELSKPGHLYLDLTGTQRLWGKAKDTAQKIMKEIKGDMGVLGSTGVGSNKLIARLASQIIPPLEAMEVCPGEERAFVSPLDIELLPSLSFQEKELLKVDLGMERVEELQRLDIPSLRLLFRSKAWAIYNQARGIDTSPVYPQHKTPRVEERIILPKDENRDEILRSYLFVLLEQCIERIHSLGLFPKKGGLLIRYCDHMEIVRSFWTKANSLKGMFKDLEPVFLKALIRKIKVRELALWFHCIKRPPVQMPLFVQRYKEEPNAIPSLDSAIREIRKRFGKEAIDYAIALKARA